MTVYKPKEFAELIGVSVSTLQRWDRDGILIADRLPSNRRIYTSEHLASVSLNHLAKIAQRDSKSNVTLPNIHKRRGRPGVDLTGRVFGELTVLGRTDDFVYASGRRDVMWLCQCSCGNQKAVRTSNLVSGGTVSCGCMRGGRRFAVDGHVSLSECRHVSQNVLSKTEAMVGKKYGRWTVESVDYATCNGSDTKIRLNCVCECGTHRSVLRSSLLSGTSLSCGCYRQERLSELLKPDDLTGMRFGHWTVESMYGVRHYPGGGQVVLWNCVCDCGNRKVVSRAALKSGESQSCGCQSLLGYRTEQLVIKCLDSMSISYRPQKTYDGLVGDTGKALSYDFCVELPNRVVLIECQGQQHYSPVKLFGGEAAFEKQVRYDAIKRAYAEEHGFELVEIPYDVRSYDDIFELLDKVFCDLN